MPLGESSEPGAPLDLVLSVPARDAVLASGRVIAIDADLKSISGYSAEDGRRLWRTPTGDGRGTHSLLLRGGSVVFWGGNQMRKVDPATGSLAPAVEAGSNGDCRFLEEGSACAYDCSCDFVLADCATGRKIGAVYPKPVNVTHGYREVTRPRCFGEHTDLVVGTEHVTIITISADKEFYEARVSPGKIALGIDASTHTEIWRNPEFRLFENHPYAGASKDGRTCWMTDWRAELWGFECASGKVLWKKPQGSGILPFVSYVTERDALFRWMGAEAVLFDLQSGSELWKTALPRAGAAIPVGAPIGPRDIRYAGRDYPAPVYVLQPSDGTIVGQTEMAVSWRVLPDPGGGFYLHLSGGELVAYDASGRERWRGHRGSPSPHEDFLALSDAEVERLTLVDRSDGSKLGQIRGRFGVQPGSSLRNGILLLRSGEDGTKIGQAIFARPRKR